MKLNRLIGILLTLSIMASCVCVSRISATADGETTFTVKAPDGEPTVLTVSAPTTVKVGDSFEITLKWSDYAFIKGDYPGYPSCFVADFSFDTRYVTFKTNHFSVYVLVETEIKLIYGPGDFLISEESEEDVNVGESVETDEAENMQQSEAIVSDQTEDISEENPDDDKASTDNSSDNSNTPLIWIVVGLAALVVVLVFIFVKKKEFLKK